MNDPVKPFRVLLNVTYEGRETAHGYDTGDVVGWSHYQHLRGALNDIATGSIPQGMSPALYAEVVLRGGGHNG